MTDRTFRLLILGITVLALALLWFGVKHASAAESDRATGWQIQVCAPDGGECRMRGPVLAGPTSCATDIVTVRWDVPDGSRLTCVQVVGGRVVRR